MNETEVIKKKLGEKIKYFRREKKYTQEAFAEKIDIEPQSLSNLERGKYAPSIDTLFRIASVLDVKLYELYLFEQIEPVEQIRKELICAINESDTLALELYKKYLELKPKTLR